MPAGSSVLVASTAPAGAPDNSLWFENDTGFLYIRFNDGSTTQWTGISGPEGPAGSNAWADITGTPATFPPTLPIAQSSVTNLVSDMALKAPLASPTLTGTPAAPTAAVADSSTTIATTAWVKAQYLTNSVVFDPPSMATGIVGVIQTLTVTGAAVGDYCLASFSVDLTGMTLLAWVSATNTVKFQFQNKTAGTLDLASGTVRVRVWKQ